MQLINCKINYTMGQSKIYTTELSNSDYTIQIENNENSLKAVMQTTKSLTDFKIEFYVKIDPKYTIYYTNGYQTWSAANELTQNENSNKILNKISSVLTKGSGFDFAGEYDSNYNANTSYGYCYLKGDTKNKILLFASLNEEDTFCKFNFDFARNILKITREFKGYTICKNQELAKLIEIESDFKTAMSILKNHLGVKDTPQVGRQLVCYNTFSEFKNLINDKIINDKIHNLQNYYDIFMVGDGYSECGYDLFCLDKKRFPIGFKQIVKNIHAKEMLAAIWIAPFALSPLASNFAERQTLALKQNEKTITTCSFWSGAYSIDVTNSQAEEYIKDLFDRICNEWEFDIIYCDCMFMAGSVPTDNHTQAMLISKGIELVRKYAQDKKLILGGVPFLSAVGKCDYIAFSQDSSSLWNNPLDMLTPEFPTSTKNNLKNMLCKSHQNNIFPCAYSIPNNAKIKSNLLKQLLGLSDMVFATESQIENANEQKKFGT